MVNKVTIAGVVVRHSQHQFQTGGRVSNFTLKSGGDFPEVKGFDKLSDIVEQFGNAEGAIFFVDGRIATDLYPDKNDDTKKKKSTYVLASSIRVIDATGSLLGEAKAESRHNGAPAEEEPLAV